LLYNTGIKKLKCDRLNVTQINCHISEKKLLGLLKVQDINLQNISPPIIINNRVYLDDIYWSKYRIDELKLNNMINNVIQNQLLITYGNRFSNIIKMIIFYPFLILVGFRMKQWQGNYLIFKALVQKILQTQVNLKGEIIKQIDFSQIKNIEKTEKLNQNQQKKYQIILNLKTVNNVYFPEKILIYNSNSDLKTDELLKIISNFMDIE
jgi:hypothetical protein